MTEVRTRRSERARLQRPCCVVSEPEIVAQRESQSDAGTLQIPAGYLTGQRLFDPQVGHIEEGDKPQCPLNMLERPLREWGSGQFHHGMDRVIARGLIFSMAPHRFHSAVKVLFSRNQRLASPLPVCFYRKTELTR